MKFTSRALQACLLLCGSQELAAFSIQPKLTCQRHQQQQQQQQQLRRSADTRLFGLLDEINSDDYNLLSSSNDKEIDMNNAYEMFLGDLVFSTNDPRIDIMSKFDQATDSAFLDWLKAKVDNSNDPDERIALRDLLEIILDVKKRAELSQMAAEREAAEKEAAEKARLEQANLDADAGAMLSNTDLLKKAAALDNAALEEEKQAAAQQKKSFYESELTPEIRMSHADMLEKFLPPHQSGESPRSIVTEIYSRFDAQFVKILTEKANEDPACGAAELIEVLAIEQQAQMARATDNLKSVLSLGEPQRMEGAMVKLAREGKIDESSLLLLEANETQARDAGANGRAGLMKQLRKRAAEEKDKQMSSKEIRLLRKLLRADDANEREKILEDAFTPKETLLVPGTAENAQKAMDGEQPDKEQALPEVPPPDFIDACKAVMINFGNLEYDDVDRTDLASRLRGIAAKAEVVATRIYGQGMSLREQQDRMWSETTTSIFDLERMEMEAEQSGEAAPWTNPDMDDDSFLPEFDSDGKMQIGGT